MSVESTVIENEKVENEYPKLMMYKRGTFVVLFESEKKGMVVQTSEDYFVGSYSAEWNVKEFKNFNGEIKLKNK